jgi:hypothetical protein
LTIIIETSTFNSGLDINLVYYILDYISLFFALVKDKMRTVNLQLVRLGRRWRSNFF